MATVAVAAANGSQAIVAAVADEHMELTTTIAHVDINVDQKKKVRNKK